MTDYTKTTNFAAKDSLPSGNANKIVKGAEIDTEFNNIATASATKANIAGPTFTGTVTIPTADINGGAVDGTTIGAASASSIVGTTIVANTSINIAGDGATVTGIKDEDDMSSNSATKLATQQSIKAYVDSQVTAQDLDVTDGSSSIDIDLDSESLGILGGTGIDSTASGTGVTLAIDSTVTTLTGSQTLTNKTLTAPTLTGTTVVASLDISGDVDVDGTLETDALSINGTTVTSTAAELNILDGVTATAAELNIMDGVTATTTELNIMDGVTSTAAELNILDGKAFLDEDDMSSNSATGIASQQSIKAYVDSQVTAQDLDFQADSGGALSIDLDSETLTFTGGTGIDTSGSGNAVTFAIDSTVATLTGSQTLTNKTLTSPDINTPDIDGGAIDGTTIGGSTPAAGSFTTLTANGSVTAAGLTVDGSSTFDDILLTAVALPSAGNPSIALRNTDNNIYIQAGSGNAINLLDSSLNTMLSATPTSHSLQISNGNAFSINSDKDISFYDGSGNAGFFWDSSAAALGIGTSSPSFDFEVNRATASATALISSGNNDAALRLYTSNNVGKWRLLASNTTQDLSIANLNSGATAFDTRLTIDSGGNVTATGTLQADRITANGAGSSNYAVYGLQNSSMTHAGYFQANGDDIAIEAIATGGTYSSDVLYVRQSSLSTGGNLARFANSTGDKVVITTAGSVGIGESSVESKLHVKDSLASTGVGSSSNPIVIIQNERQNTGTSSAVLRFDTNEISGTSQYARAAIGAEYDGSSNVNGRLLFSTADTSGNLQEAMRINGNRTIGVNSTATNRELTISAVTGGGQCDLALRASDDNNYCQLLFGDTSADNTGIVGYKNGDEFMFFNTGGQERMRIDSIGAVTKPYQPAFQARMTANQSNIAVGSAITVTFDQEIFDQGSDFNPSNYKFTAPVTGKYQLNAMLYMSSLDADVGYYEMYIFTDNRTYYAIVDPDVFDEDATYWGMNISVLADLDANDAAYVAVRQNTGTVQTDVNSASFFSGFLVA